VEHKQQAVNIERPAWETDR
jgi:hypothetical protein